MKSNLKKPEDYKPDERDEDDRRIIRMSVSDDSNFLSPFSPEGRPVVSGETAEFLNHSLKHRLKDTRIHLMISSSRIDDVEKGVYKEAIANYYNAEYFEVQRELKKNAIVSAVMTAIAAAVFTLAVILGTLTGTHAVILSMLDVFAWVFMWEAVDLFFFRRPELRLRQRRNLSIINAKLTFIDVSNLNE